MKLGIMQPYFLPYLGYWQLLNAVDKYVIYDDVNYIKRGWISRNRILIQGVPQYIRLELRQVSQNKRICEISLAENSPWRNKLIKTVEMAYHKAPYFDEVYSIIKKIMEYDESNLSIFLTYSINAICDYLKIKTDLQCSSSLKDNTPFKGEKRVIDICDRFGATEYYNAIGGKGLYSEKSFREKGIKLFFLRAYLTEYPQFGNAFVEGLSILDVMMFNSVEQIQKMLNEYDLERASTMIE